MPELDDNDEALVSEARLWAARGLPGGDLIGRLANRVDELAAALWYAEMGDDA